MYICIYVYMNMSVCAYMYACIYVYIYVYTYVYIYTHRIIGVRITRRRGCKELKKHCCTLQHTATHCNTQ